MSSQRYKYECICVYTYIYICAVLNSVGFGESIQLDDSAKADDSINSEQAASIARLDALLNAVPRVVRRAMLAFLVPS